MKHYIGIAGSNRKGSTNKKLIEFIKERYSNDQQSIDLMSIAGLPVFYKTPDHTIPDAAHKMADQIAKADGVIISTPEYDHGVPAVLMNALAWLSYSVHPFADKPVLIIGASYGTLGTSRAQRMLRQMLEAPELGARVLSNSEYLLGHSLQAFDENDQLNEDKLIKLLDKVMADFDAFVNVNKDVKYKRSAAFERIRQLEENN